MLSPGHGTKTTCKQSERALDHIKLLFSFSSLLAPDPPWAKKGVVMGVACKHVI